MQPRELVPEHVMALPAACTAGRPQPLLRAASAPPPLWPLHILLALLLLQRALPPAAGLDPAIADPQWPGDAFPPLPSGWPARTWSLRGSTAGFFLGNTSGANTLYESQRESSLAVVGLGWQLGLRHGSDWAADGGLEARQRAAAQLLKQLQPATKVVVSAELDCTFPQWAASRDLLLNRTLARQVFMTRPNGSLWLDHKWGGLFEQPWYNFSDPVAVDWWINSGPIAAAMREPSIDGVYLDGADPDDNFYRENFGSALAVQAFKDAQRRALSRAIATWRARAPHKYLGGYAAPRVKPEQQPNHCPPGSCAGPEELLLSGPAACADTMRLLISRAGWDNQTLMVATRHHPHDPLAIATFACKPPWWSQNCRVNSTRDPAPEVAAFLVARGPSALFQVVMQPAHSVDYRVSATHHLCYAHRSAAVPHSTLSFRSCLYLLLERSCLKTSPVT
jgi:hypothetical protein